MQHKELGDGKRLFAVSGSGFRVSGLRVWVLGFVLGFCAYLLNKWAPNGASHPFLFFFFITLKPRVE